MNIQIKENPRTMKNTALALAILSLQACSGAQPKPRVPLVTVPEPMVVARSGTGPLVTIMPDGRWIWNRPKREVVSELLRANADAAGAVNRAEVAQKEEASLRAKCEERLSERALTKKSKAKK